MTRFCFGQSINCIDIRANDYRLTGLTNILYGVFVMEWGPKLNLVLAWTWILAGFLSGMLLGLGFHKEEFLGGYTSHKRRLYRLGHISFFGLGVLNFIFYLTAVNAAASAQAWTAASIAFLVGGITMPICCVLMAHNRNLQMIFSVPVLSLIAGAVLTIWQIIRL